MWLNYSTYIRTEILLKVRKTITLKAYEPGSGTEAGASDSLAGAATGLGDTGVPAQVKRLFGNS